MITLRLGARLELILRLVRYDRVGLAAEGYVTRVPIEQ